MKPIFSLFSFCFFQIFSDNAGDPILQLRSYNQQLYDQYYKFVYGNICNEYHFFNLTFNVSQMSFILEIDNQVIINSTESYDHLNYDSAGNNLPGPYFFKIGLLFLLLS